MFRAFPKKPYRQRAKIETVFSTVKRKLSSRATGRSLTIQIRQAPAARSHLQPLPPEAGLSPYRISTELILILNNLIFIVSTLKQALMALLTSWMSEPMPQAVEVIGKTEQQSLADLDGQAAPGSARGELALNG